MTVLADGGLTDGRLADGGLTDDGLAGPTAHHEAVMGTVFTLDVRTGAPRPQVGAAVAEAVAWLHWVDATFSTYRADSEVSRFDRGEVTIDGCSVSFRHIVALCHRFNQLTNGYFDAWTGGRFDPSGVVKGWAAQEASSILTRRGLPDHIVDGGGDLCLSGSPGPARLWAVAVRHPLHAQAFSAALGLKGGAVATSGTYERGGHVVDPFTGQAAAELVSVTVVGPELVSADAFATAALAMGRAAPGWLAALPGYEAQVVAPNGEGWASAGFKALTLV
jgi:FAD:protein FMN transferase